MTVGTMPLERSAVSRANAGFAAMRRKIEQLARMLPGGWFSHLFTAEIDDLPH